MYRRDSNELAAIPSPLLHSGLSHGVCSEGSGPSPSPFLSPFHATLIFSNCTAALQPIWEDSWAADVVSHVVVLVSGPGPCRAQAVLWRLPPNSSTYIAVAMEMPHSKSLNSVFYKLYTSFKVAWNSLIFLSLSYTPTSVFPACFWQFDFMRHSNA